MFTNQHFHSEQYALRTTNSQQQSRTTNDEQLGPNIILNNGGSISNKTNLNGHPISVSIKFCFISQPKFYDNRLEIFTFCKIVF